MDTSLTQNSAQPARAPFRARIGPFAVGATGIALLLLAYYALNWNSITAAIDVCEQPFCDFVDYYYRMGWTIFRTELPVTGFLCSPFIAILLAVFPPFGLTVSLGLWGILQVLFLVLYLLLFYRLVPTRPQIQLLFVALALSSFPLLFNFMGGSVSVFMIVALLGLLVSYERGHRASAGGLLAFSVSFKFFPILFFAPFVARRDSRFVLIAAAACGVFLFMVPGLLLGAGDTLRFYGALLDSFRESGWVSSNPHSQFLPHLVLRLADEAGYNAHAQLPLLYCLAYGIAAANMGLILLIQRARLRYANLWSFLLVFLTLPFFLKTSWPHDFAFLSFAQGLLVWQILEGRKSAPCIYAEERRSHASRYPRVRIAVTVSFLLLSIVFSNIVFFNLFDDFTRYGFYGFIFWANLLLMMALYVELLPSVVRRSDGTEVEYGRRSPRIHPKVAGTQIRDWMVSFSV